MWYGRKCITQIDRYVTCEERPRRPQLVYIYTRPALTSLLENMAAQTQPSLSFILAGHLHQDVPFGTPNNPMGAQAHVRALTLFFLLPLFLSLFLKWFTFLNILRFRQRIYPCKRNQTYYDISIYIIKYMIHM